MRSHFDGPGHFRNNNQIMNAAMVNTAPASNATCVDTSISYPFVTDVCTTNTELQCTVSNPSPITAGQ